MNEIRIKLPPELHQKWSKAARLRGLSVTSFVTVTVSEALLKTGELRYDSTISGLHQDSTIDPPTPVKPKPVSSSDPFDHLPDPRKLAESLNFDVNFLEEGEAPMTPETQAVLDVWDDED